MGRPIVRQAKEEAVKKEGKRGLIRRERMGVGNIGH